MGQEKLGVKANECPFCGSVSLDIDEHPDGSGGVCGVSVVCRVCESSGPTTAVANAGNANDTTVHDDELVAACMAWNARTRSLQSVSIRRAEGREWWDLAIAESFTDEV